MCHIVLGNMTTMSKPYRYVSFRWWNPVNLEKMATELRNDFKVKKVTPPSNDMELVLHKDERPEIWVTADTLTARLSIYRVILFQKVTAPFTNKDVKLRNKMLELYPRGTGTPFPFGYRNEPKFEVAQ